MGMKRRTALLTTLAIALTLAACGGATLSSSTKSGISTASAPSKPIPGKPIPEYARVDADSDNDVEAPADDTNNNRSLDFGHEAGEPEKRIITALVKRYYAIALAGNGAEACALIYSPLAESVPEDYGSNQPPGPPYMKGTTCRMVLDGLFQHFHAQLAAEVPQLKVTGVRLIEHHGNVELSFGRLPEREILVGREGRVWRMAALLDRELP
jgi:hypothetical protein